MNVPLQGRPRAEALRVLAASSRFTLAEARRVDPRAFRGVVAAVGARAIAATAGALALRGLVDALAALRSSGEPPALGGWLALAAGAGLLGAMAPVLGRHAHERLGDALATAQAEAALAHAATLDAGSLEARGPREIVQRALSRGVTHGVRLLGHLRLAVEEALQVAVAAALLLWLEPLFVAVAALLGAPYLLHRWELAWQHHAAEGVRDARRRWTAHYASLLTVPGSATEVRLLGLAPELLARFRDQVAALSEEDRARARVEARAATAFAVASSVALYVLLARIAWRAAEGALSVGGVVLFAALGARLRMGLDRGLAALGAAAESALLVADLRAFLALPSSLPAPPARIQQARPANGSPSPGEIRVEDVWFTYPHAQHPVLRGVDLHVPAGLHLGLVGRNGSGKTTLLKLLARVHDPDRGRILLDGVDLRDWPLDALHARLALLLPGAARFEATAFENVAFGDWPAAATDRERVARAARAATIDDRLRALERGYDTRLGRLFGDTDLSAGEWQKLALARGLCREAGLLLLDEPAAHLDAESERALGPLLREHLAGRTVVLVSHRTAPLYSVDRIAVLSAGRVVATGRAEEVDALAGAQP